MTGAAARFEWANGAAASRTSAIQGTLYGLRGAPPSMSAELMLEHKGIRCRRVDLMPLQHAKALAKRGFPAGTAPALDLDGRLVQTNMAIARALDAAVPEPPLFPADPTLRLLVGQAERFCDELFQPAARRIAMWTFYAEPEVAGFHPRLGPVLPRGVPGPVRRRLTAKALDHYGVTSVVAAEDARALPAMLDRIDVYIWEGILNGAELNAADFQIAPLICGLSALGHLESQIADRPAAELAERVLPPR